MLYVMLELRYCLWFSKTKENLIYEVWDPWNSDFLLPEHCRLVWWDSAISRLLLCWHKQPVLHLLDCLFLHPWFFLSSSDFSPHPLEKGSEQVAMWVFGYWLESIQPKEDKANRDSQPRVWIEEGRALYLEAKSELQPVDLLLSWQNVENKKFIAFLRFNSEVKNIKVPKRKDCYISVSKKRALKDWCANNASVWVSSTASPLSHAQVHFACYIFNQQLPWLIAPAAGTPLLHGILAY